jgi:hypothetical protein
MASSLVLEHDDRQRNRVYVEYLLLRKSLRTNRKLKVDDVGNVLAQSAISVVILVGELPGSWGGSQHHRWWKKVRPAGQL